MNIIKYLCIITKLSDELDARIIDAIFALGSIILLFIIVHFLSFHYFKNTLFSSFFSNDKERIKLKKKAFNNFVPPSFKINYTKNNIDSDTITYKKLKKFFKNNKYLIISGSMGYGKSTVLERLTYDTRGTIYNFNFKFFDLFKMKNLELIAYSVIYIRLKLFTNIDEIMEEINRKLKEPSSNNISLFIDAFDEFPFIKQKNIDSTEVFIELINRLDNDPNVTEKIKRICFTTRPEIFINGVGSLEKIYLQKSECGLNIVSISKLSKEKAVKLYKKNSKNSYIFYDTSSGQKIEKEKRKDRVLNYKKIKDLIDNDSDSVFRIPVVIVNSFIVFKNKVSDAILKKISLFGIIKLIILYSLKREINKSKINSNDKDNSNEIYQQLCKLVLEKAKQVVNKDDNDMSYKLEEISNMKYQLESKEEFKKFLSYTTFLLTTDWNENQIEYECKEIRLEFIHQIYFWTILADAMVNDNNLSKEDRFLIYDKLLNDESLKLYEVSFLTKYSESIRYVQLNSKKEVEDIRIINTKIINNKKIINDIKIDDLFNYFPKINRIGIGVLTLNKNFIEDYRKYNFLNFSNFSSYADTENVTLITNIVNSENVKEIEFTPSSRFSEEFTLNLFSMFKNLRKIFTKCDISFINYLMGNLKFEQKIILNVELELNENNKSIDQLKFECSDKYELELSLPETDKGFKYIKTISDAIDNGFDIKIVYIPEIDKDKIIENKIFRDVELLKAAINIFNKKYLTINECDIVTFRLFYSIYLMCYFDKDNQQCKKIVTDIFDSYFMLLISNEDKYKIHLKFAQDIIECGCAINDGRAYYLKGFEFETGNFTYEKSIESAIDNYKLAYSNGYENGKIEVARIYIDNQMTDRYLDAYNLLSELCDKSNSTTLYYIGKCYLNGYGVEKNIDKGKEFLVQSGLDDNLDNNQRIYNTIVNNFK